MKDEYEKRNQNIISQLRQHIQKIKAENKKLNEIISDIEDWAIVSFDEPLLKLIKELKDGKSRN